MLIIFFHYKSIAHISTSTSIAAYKTQSTTIESNLLYASYNFELVLPPLQQELFKLGILTL